MTLGSYYKKDRFALGSNPTSEQLLDEARSKLEQNAYSEEILEEFKQFLNDLYYPKVKTNFNLTEQMNTMIGTYEERKAVEGIKDIRAKITDINNLQTQIDSGEISNDNQGKSIQKEVLKEYQEIFNIVKEFDFNKFPDYKNQIETAYNYAQNLIDNIGEKSKIQISKGNNNLNALTLKAKIDYIRKVKELLPQLTILIKGGEAFERTLKNAGNIPFSIVNIFGNRLTAEKLGQSLTQKGTISDNMQNILNNTNKNYLKNQETYQIGNGVTINIKQNFNPYSSRMGKTDVAFTYRSLNDSTPQELNVSAKAWLKGITNEHNFGKTNLAYALIRGINETFIEQYAFVMQDETSESSKLINNFHKMAKIGVALDTIFGKSQSNKQMANIIVINTGQKILVHSFNELLDKIASLNEVNGYNDSSIHSTLSNLRANIPHKKGRSTYYYGLALNYLANIEVSILYNSLFSS